MKGLFSETQNWTKPECCIHQFLVATSLTRGFFFQKKKHILFNSLIRRWSVDILDTYVLILMHDESRDFMYCIDTEILT